MPIMKTVSMSHHFPSLSEPNSKLKKVHRNSPISHACNEFGFYNDKHFNSVLLHSHPSSRCSLIVGVSSSSAEFPGQWWDEEEKRTRTKKRQSIAGIDQDELVDDPALLADPDSCFCEFRGVKLHHKICDPELTEKNESLRKVIGFPMILLHGFGASVFSWNRVMKCLATIVGAKVLAFDRPAFGLTSRLELSKGKADASNGLNPYCLAFSVLATLHFIGLLGAEKAILVGHSAGALVAVNSYFEAPERVAALILVAPAIFAPLTSRREAAKGNKPVEEDSSSRKSPWDQLVRFCSPLFEFSVSVVKGILGIVNSLYKKLLKFFLRSTFGVALIRIIIDKFGLMGVKKAWYNSNLATEEVLAGYTKPLRTKGWDKALVEHTVSMLTDVATESKPPLSQRLNEISCPVLIVTGDSDLIVPAWNGKRLSRAIPGSHFEVIKQCGHLPHEEKADEFISLVKKFLLKTFADFAEQPLV